MERQYAQFKILAALMGAKIDDSKAEKPGEQFAFKDPAEYRKLSSAEKKKATQEMKDFHMGRLGGKTKL